MTHFDWLNRRTGLLVAGLLGSASAAAQQPGLPADYPVQAGLRLGYAWHHLHGSAVDAYTGAGGTSQPLPGLAAGVVVRGRLAGPVALQGEMLYVRKGGQLEGGRAAGSGRYEVHYLSVPLLAQLRVLRHGPLAWHLEAGYTANLALSGPDLDPRAFPTGTQFDDRGVVLGPVLGTELALTRGRGRYALHVRYSLDQGNFLTRRYAAQDYALRTSGFIISTSALLGLK